MAPPVTESVASDMPNQQARCRELLKVYHEIGPHGRFAAAMLEASLREADQALASGDIVRILQAYQRLRGHE